MPNSGDTDPAQSLGPVGSPGAVAPAPPAEAAQSEEVGAVGGLDGVTGASSADAPAAIAQALAAGTIDAQTAQARLIEAAVRARLPSDAAPEAVAALRAEVAALLGSDPLLADLLRP
ncbi:MAG: hypothetical protein AB1Z98_14905 [Nannocystaceae bacterium]